MKCFAFSPVGRTRQTNWLKEACPGRSAQGGSDVLAQEQGGPHHTHTIRSNGSLVYCSCCGYWSISCVKGLARECPGYASTYHARCLGYLKRGLLPPAVADRSGESAAEEDDLLVEEEPPGGLWASAAEEKRGKDGNEEEARKGRSPEGRNPDSEQARGVAAQGVG